MEYDIDEEIEREYEDSITLLKQEISHHDNGIYSSLDLLTCFHTRAQRISCFADGAIMPITDKPKSLNFVVGYCTIYLKFQGK